MINDGKCNASLWQHLTTAINGALELYNAYVNEEYVVWIRENAEFNKTKKKKFFMDLNKSLQGRVESLIPITMDNIKCGSFCPFENDQEKELFEKCYLETVNSGVSNIEHEKDGNGDNQVTPVKGDAGIDIDNADKDDQHHDNHHVIAGTDPIRVLRSGIIKSQPNRSPVDFLAQCSFLSETIDNYTIIKPHLFVYGG